MEVFLFNLVMLTRDAMVCRKGLFERAPAQRAVRDRVKFPEVVKKKYRNVSGFLILIAI